MKQVTLGNIAWPAFNRAGAAGRDNLPALIGRIIAVGALMASVAHSTGSGQATVRVNHSKSVADVVASLQLPTSLLEASYDSGRHGVSKSDALQPSLDRVAMKGGC